MRILHVLPSLGLGGTGRLALDLLAHLRGEMNLNVRLCVLGSPVAHETGTDLGSRITFAGCDSPAASPAQLAKCVRFIVKEARSHQADIIHSHLLPADLPAAIASWSLGVGHVAHVHDTRPWLMSSRMQDRVRRSAYRIAYAAGATRFIAVSTAAATHLGKALSIPPSRIAVILNGIEVERFSRSSVAEHNGPFVIGAAGRFAPEKGYHILIDAVARMARAGTDVRLRLAGAGSSEAKLRGQAAAAGIGDQLEIAGNVADMRGFYESLDAFALPSLAAEGLPLVMLEAMAAGLPVVATDTAGVRDVITDGMDGLIVPLGDAAALASAMQELADAPDRRRRIATAAHERVKADFTIARTAGDVAAFYARL